MKVGALFAFLFLVTLCSNGQTDTVIIGQNASLGLSVKRVCTTDSCCYLLCGIKNSKPKQFVFLMYPYEFAYDTCVISKIVMQSVSFSEVLVALSYSGSGSGSMGGSDFQQIQKCVVDLNRKENLFSAIPIHHESYWQYYSTNDTSISLDGRIETSTCSWNYDFDINDKNIITISKLKRDYLYAKQVNGKIVESGDLDCHREPDHIEGVYVLKNGVFTMDR